MTRPRSRRPDELYVDISVKMQEECLYRGQGIVGTVAEIAALIPPGVRPLEWVKHPKADLWRCDTIVGLYQVSAVTGNVSWTFDGLPGQYTRIDDLASADAAFVEVFADYEARILSVLTQPKEEPR